MAYEILQSSTQAPLLFFLVQTSDHITGLTGASPTVTISKAGAAFGSPAGAVTEIASGWYKVAGNATDSNTLGPIALHATAASADPFDNVVANIVAYNPQDAVRLGLTALPNVASGSAGAIPTTGSGANQIAVNGSGKISGVVLTDTVTTYTGDTPQTGDSFARIGAAGAGLTSVGVAAAGLDSVVVSDLAGVPTTTAKIVDAIAFLFMGLRNLRSTTSSQDKVSNNAGSAIGTAAVSDDGTTFSKGKYS